ncbi:MAG: MSMEG_0565 family glycosyltransferase [Candidatus Nanopelagicales bacterium]|nr:MSMEG_0565 family glycosyltransferase [Candidatus Nanopelagicales bacterium]
MTFAGRLALLTYSTKPRGGVVHSLELAEALSRQGVDVHLFALGSPGTSFFRPTSVPFTLFPAVDQAQSLDEKVFASVASMAEGLAGLRDTFDLIHAQDCISGRAAMQVSRSGPVIPVIRTVHHVDDFTTQALIDCQRQAIVEPDRILVVSQTWQSTLQDDYGVPADIVPNGVRPERFPQISELQRTSLRESVGVTDGKLILAVGGVEPRKGSRELFQALGILKSRGHQIHLAILGGHSFQDYEDYRQEAIGLLPSLGLELGRDVITVGTVDEQALGQWFRAADVLAYPSTKEGFGLVALEGLAADLPVVASSIPVFKEFLTDGVSALLPETGNPEAISDAIESILLSNDLRSRLIAGGQSVLADYTWEASAIKHCRIYREVLERFRH